MKKFTTSLLMTLMALLLCPSVLFAEETTLTPVQTTVIQANGTTAQNEEVVLYKADATAWRCSQAKISGGAFANQLANYEGSPVVITKFNASEFLTGKSLKKAVLKFKSKCTVSGKNSNVQIAHIGTGWDATTATWANTNKGDILNAVNLNGDGVNVKTSQQELTQDVTDLLAASTDGTIGFGIYTFTGREQEVTDFTLTIEAIDASASSTYTIKYVDEAGNELKASETRSESIGGAATITIEDKAAIYNADKTKKYIYVSDDSEGKTVASDASTVVTITFREAAIWNYTINAVDGEGNPLKTLKKGTNFEAETFDVAYAAYINVDGTIYKSSKLSSDKKGYYFSMTLDADNTTKDVAFTASDITGVVYFSEAEDIEGLTLTNNSNTFIRSSNGASAYAKDGDVVFTTLPNGKYKIATVICDASKNAGSVWNFKAGDTNVFEFTATSVNWAEGTSEEFELNAASTDITLVKNGGNNQGVDLIYIIKTGDAELTTPSIPAAENIAALKALADGTEATLTLNKAKVLVSRGSMSGRTAVVEDESGVIAFGADLMGMLMEFEVTEGKAVTGKITGVYTVVNGIPTFAGSENTGSESAGDAVTAVEDFTLNAVEVTIADAKKAENLLKVVTIKDLTLSYNNTGMREFTATQGTENINVVDAMMTPSWSYVTDEYMKEDEEGYNFPPFESMTALVYADANGTVLYPIEFVAKKVEEPARVWDFTKWSEETINNLKADAATVTPDGDGKYPAETPWRTYEKQGGPTETDPDRGGAAFWYGTAIAEAQTLTANGTEIAETAGLLFDKMTAGSLAIAVNYPSTTLGTYAGPAYLWIGGKTNSFTIPAVKPGSAIEITIESHKPAEGRGVKLSVGGEVIGEAIPTTVETFTINVPASDAETVDVKVENTNGCHIYTIKIDENPATAVENIAALKALADGTDATLAVNGTKVTFVSGTDAYIEDETGALLIEGEGLNLTAGKAITGTINGKLTIVKEKLHKFVATEANVTEADAQIAATVLTITEANKPENISKLVKLENVDANIDYQQIVDSNDEYIMFLDKYNVLGGENPKKVESIVGVLGFMGTNTNMFYPVSKDSIVAAPVVPAKEVKTIAEMKAVEDGTEVNFVMNNVKVTSISAGRMSSFGTIEDETGAIQLGSDMISSIFMEQGISEGMAVSGHVTGTYSVVDGIPTFDISENTGVADELTGTEATITPSEATIAGVKNAESISKYVILKDVKVTGVEEGFAVAFTAAQGEETIAVEDVMMDPLTREGVLSKYVEYGEDGSTTISLPEMFESMTAIVSIDWHGNYVLYPKAVVEKEAQEEIAVVWDFTKWSEETVNNLKADAATVEPDADGKYPAVTPWRSYEKAGGPTDTDPDRGGAAFWYGTAITEAQSLTANGTEIAETAGLLFDKMSAGALAIAVDYPSTSLGTYDGPSYLWIGGKNHTFVIPAVKPGSTIEIKVETHKNGDARGLKLSVGGEVIGEAIPTTVETFRIVVPASDAETVDVKVENTNGCHIYTIGINDYEKINTGISSIKSDVKAVSGVYTINGVKVRNAGESLDGLAKGLYIIDGKKVVIK